MYLVSDGVFYDAFRSGILIFMWESLASRRCGVEFSVDGFLRSVNAGQRVEYMSSIVFFTTAAHLLSTPPTFP